MKEENEGLGNWLYGSMVSCQVEIRGQSFEKESDMVKLAELMFGVAGLCFFLTVSAGIAGHIVDAGWLAAVANYGFWLMVGAGVAGYVSLGVAPVVWRHQRKGVVMKRMLLVMFALVLVAAAPTGAWAAGYETRNGSTSTSTTDSVSGVPVPGGGTRNTSTSNSANESWSRSQPRYDAWERVNMTAATAANVAGAIQSVASILGGIGAGPIVATPTGVYAPNGGGYGGGYGGYGYNNGGQVPPFVYQRAASAPPAPICYTYAGVCDVWTPQGWQRIPMPTAQPAPMPTVTVSVGQPVPVSRQCTDGRGFYWLC